MIGLSFGLSLSRRAGGVRATGTAAFTQYGVKPYLVLDGPSNQYLTRDPETEDNTLYGVVPYLVLNAASNHNLTRTPRLADHTLYGVVPYFVMDAASNQFLAGAA